MKKKSITCSILLGMTIFLLFSNINVVAAPPSWVGVSAGETHTWSMQLNPENFVKFATGIGAGAAELGDIEDQLEDAMAILGGEFPAITFSLTIETISDLITGTFNHVLVNCSPSMGIPGVTEMNLGDLGLKMSIQMLAPDTPNWTMTTFMAMSSMMSMSLSEEPSPTNPVYMPLALIFVPTTVNWETEAQNLNDMLVAEGISSSNLSISAIEGGYGLECIIAKRTLNATTQLEDITFKLSYNSNGVLGQLDVLYGLDSVISVGPPPPETIPGFEIPIIIGISCIASIGVIFYIKKKKVNIKN